MRKDSSVLDLLRAAAVLLVLAAHLAETLVSADGGAIDRAALRLGRVGVLFFFVHTSVVLMMSLARSHARGGGLPVEFYLRRAFRIYPLAIVTVMVVVAFHLPRSAWGARPSAWSSGVVFANVFLVQNLTRAPYVLTPLWTLPLELQMYVVLPFIFWILRRGEPLRTALGLWAASVAAALMQPALGDRLDVLMYAPCFLAGIIAFVTARAPGRRPFWLWPLLVASVAGVYLAVPAAPYDEQPSAWWAWMLCLVMGLAIPHMRETSSRLVRGASHVVAKYSYGIYLSHMLALWLAFRSVDTSSTSVHIIVFTLLIVALPAITYHLVEAPGIRLGARLAASLSFGVAPPAQLVPPDGGAFIVTVSAPSR